jgi:hypothetical protein
MPRANGSFDVKLTPEGTPDVLPGSTLASLAIDKIFRGDLAATSMGRMLSAATDVKGSAGYVAIERVAGTLHGRSGTFVLQHNGIMTRGAGQLTITVVPDSGAGELAGLAGQMTIDITGGKHFYDFDYTLPGLPQA